MSRLRILFAFSIILITPFFSQAQTEESSVYKCLVQTTNYEGEGAYIIVSLIDSTDAYAQTLYILGDDPEWFHTIDNWWAYFGKKKRKTDGITGATLSGGERQVITFKIPKSAIDAGYKIRFETCVEDQKYVPVDLEIPLRKELPKTPINGSEYIRYVRIMPN